MDESIVSVIAELRKNHDDSQFVEVKSGINGFPDSLTETFSAMANLPGGGLVILGLDESNNFRPVGLVQTAMMKKSLGNLARQFVPPVVLTIDDVDFEGSHIVVARIKECDSDFKPCYHAKTKRSYVRSYDGDYEMSELEKRAFVNARKSSMVERKTVPGTDVNSLDADLLEQWISFMRENDPLGLGRFNERNTILQHAGIVGENGELTVAGLVSLGEYPQRFLPRFVIHMANMINSEITEIRARNVRTFTGPIPMIMASAMKWISNNIGYTSVNTDSGVKRTPDYPLIAIRELLSNALVHRDLGDWSSGFAVEVRLYRDKFVIRLLS